VLKLKIASLYLAPNRDARHRGCSALGQVAVPPAPPKTFRGRPKRFNYRRAGAAKIDFQGTELMQQANGEARVRTRAAARNRCKILGLDEATKFGLEYLTYVLWAVSPGGRAVNLGEVVLKKRRREVQSHLRHADLLA